MLQETDHFDVRTDSGRIVEIIEYADVVDVSDSSGPGVKLGLKSYYTSDGMNVNRISPVDFEILTPSGSIHAVKV